MITTPYTILDRAVLQSIPSWAGMTINFIALNLCLPVGPELIAALDLLIADGLVMRHADCQPPKYQLTAFGALVSKATRQGNAVYASLALSGALYAVEITGLRDATEPPFLRWVVTCGTWTAAGDALNERHAWQRVKVAIEASIRAQEEVSA